MPHATSLGISTLLGQHDVTVPIVSAFCGTNHKLPYVDQRAAGPQHKSDLAFL
jgi:hypothetical protein